jgi:hypothetical protein
MNNSGLYNLGDVALAAINAATTATVITSATDEGSNGVAYIDGLEGMQAVTLQANFNYGSGGTSIKVDVETTCDQGTTWVPIARFSFTTAAAEKLFNLSGLTAKTSAVTPAALSDDAVIDGIFGTRLRCRITTVGTYAGNTSLSVRAITR